MYTETRSGVVSESLTDGSEQRAVIERARLGVALRHVDGSGVLEAFGRDAVPPLLFHQTHQAGCIQKFTSVLQISGIRHRISHGLFARAGS